MRMRDGDAGKAAEALTISTVGAINERNAVPQDVALVGLHDQAALPDREAGTVSIAIRPGSSQR